MCQCVSCETAVGAVLKTGPSTGRAGAFAARSSCCAHLRPPRVLGCYQGRRRRHQLHPLLISGSCCHRVGILRFFQLSTSPAATPGWPRALAQPVRGPPLALLAHKGAGGAVPRPLHHVVARLRHVTTKWSGEVGMGGEGCETDSTAVRIGQQWLRPNTSCPSGPKSQRKSLSCTP